jgi:exosortase H (IPTLxxWG-CTERM-specific)
MTRRHNAAEHGPKHSRTPGGGPAAHGARGESWLADKGPILRFFLIFAALVTPLFVVYYAYYEHSAILYRYLSLNARVSAALLRCFGTPATAEGLAVSSPRFGLRVAQGCDAVQPTILFLCAVLASPVAFRLKLPGLLIGVPLLLVLNLVRIVSLCYVRMYFPTLFGLMHIDVWQALFIFLALLFWILWARWAKGRAAKAKQAHVSA